ncbi:hypothetical protein I3842_08G107000 [Carya illinoinensis]|uniref:PGG domain-containing protein n=1 Tax=Carya illinoinensis TaxID=32201 RepID=A0A922EEG9_CARIL|nr:hypothetical protein I3842_08G107000 [Carya illinoinensis]
MAFNLDGIIIETEMQAIKKDLLRNSTKGQWNGVIDIYNKHPEVHAAKLTINEDTALHIAVSSDRKETVEQLMKIIARHHGEGQEIPKFKNKGGNTLLHVAASMGSVTLCRSIVETGRQLGLSFMEARNCKGETPLFLAALCAKKEAFISVHEVYQENNLNYNDLSCRSDDDGTILHVAIATKRFDLALEIIELYPKLVHFVNKQGFSPLHVLASDPSAFESATLYGLVLRLLVKCFPRVAGYLRDHKQERKLAACKVMNELLKLLDQDGPNMIIRPEMVGDQKQKNPTNGSTSGLGSKEKGGETEDLENPQIRSSPRQEHRGFPCAAGYLRDDKQKRKLAACKVMKELEILDLDGETDSNMIIGLEMVGDQKQKSPTDGSTSGLVSMARETPILIATKNGITEMVEKILEFFPEAVYDVDSNMKNIVLLSVEHKQPHVYELLLNKKNKNIIHDSLFWEVDNNGNTALHLAAKVANSNPWPVDGPALQMNWEIKWFEHVQKSMPESYPFLCNKAGETPREVFTKSHEVLVEEGRKWLIGVSNFACPVATGIFVTVAFSSTPKPNVQINETNSRKQMELFQYSLVSISYSISFFLSVTAVLCFLRIITSSYSERSFRQFNILWVLLYGLAAFYLSMILTLASFIYGHTSFTEPDYINLPYTGIAIPGLFLVLGTLLPSYSRTISAWSRVPHRMTRVVIPGFVRL